MATQEGRFNTAGVFDGTYFDYEVEYVIFELQVVSAQQFSHITLPLGSSTGLDPFGNPVQTTPGGDPCSTGGAGGALADVKVFYTGGEVTDLLDVTVTLNSDKEVSTFSFTTTAPDQWTPFVRNELAAGNITKLVTIFMGPPGLRKIFTGFVTAADATFPRKEGEATFTGVDLSEKLRLTASDIPDPSSSTAANLITQMMAAAGFTMGSFRFIHDLLIAYVQYFPTTLRAILDAIMRTQPDVDYAVDANGHFYARNSAEALGGGGGWVYSPMTNCKKVTYRQTADQLVTEVAVVGGVNIDGPVTLNHESTLITKYGRRKAGIDSFILVTDASAEAAARSLVRKSTRGLSTVMVEAVSLNAALKPLTIVSMKDLDKAQGGKGLGFGFTGQQVVLRSVTHSWNRESNPAGSTSFRGDLPRPGGI